MARETRAITITIKTKNKAAPSPSAPKPSKPEEKNAEAKSETKSAAQNLSSWLVHKALNEAEQQLKSAVDYEFSMYYSTHDDYIGQRNFEIARANINMAVKVGTSLYSGVSMAASIGGPIGAAISAAAAVVSTGVDLALQYSRAMEQQQLKIDQMNAQLSYTRQRSGYSLTSGSVGEDR